MLWRERVGLVIGHAMPWWERVEGVTDEVMLARVRVESRGSDQGL